MQNINKKCYAKLHPDCDYNFPDYFDMQDSEAFLYFAGNEQTDRFTAEIIEVYGLEIKNWFRVLVKIIIYLNK